MIVGLVGAVAVAVVLLLVAVLGVDGEGEVEDLLGRRLGAGPALLPEDGEGPVVDGQVLGPAHEGRPAGPVDGVAVVEADRGRGASAKVRTLPIGTASPPPRSTRAKATASSLGRRALGPPRAARQPGSEAALEGLLDQVGDAVLAHPLLVLAVLQHGAERGGDRRLGQLGRPSTASAAAQSIVSATPGGL